MNEIIARESKSKMRLETDCKITERFFKIFTETAQQINGKNMVLKAARIDTVLGPMIAVADDESLYLLEFIGSRGLEREIAGLRHRGFTIIQGNEWPLQFIKEELKAYFDGQLSQFKTPYRMLGSPFQQQVWLGLCQIPYGETRSYKDQAVSIGKPNGYRAVGNANGANQLSIIIPCHRVISSDGTLGGYDGGLMIKQWLIDHEKNYKV